jgi:hypothetical protein
VRRRRKQLLAAGVVALAVAAIVLGLRARDGTRTRMPHNAKYYILDRKTVTAKRAESALR